MKLYSKRFSLYGIISLLSVLIRQNLIPTPAEALGFQVFGISTLIDVFENYENLELILKGLPGLLINYIIEAPVHVVTYAVTGFYYSKGDGAVKGSFLYFIFYLVHVFVLTSFCWVHFLWWAIILIISGYIVIHILLNKFII